MTPSGRRRRQRRHRRRTALRRYDLGTNANRFTTKLKPVRPDWAIFIVMGDTFCLQK